MKILFITSSSINGGAQKHIKEMFKSLSSLGHDVFLCAPEGWLVDELKGYSSNVIPLDLNRKNVVKLKKVFDMVKPDVTNTFILSGGVYGTLAWKKRKYGKLFVTVNNPVIYPGISFLGKMVYPRMYRWMSRFAAAFLVKSDKVRDEVIQVIKKKKPVISIKNGIDFNIFDKDKEYADIRSENGIKKDDIVITNVAALDVRKGQKYLIEAVIELKREFPIHLLLVGEGDDSENLKSLVKEKSADNYIHFLGRRSDINVVLANSDIFVLPSLHEGLPNALMEAMAMGLPCVATDVGGVRQLIDDQESGIVVKSKDCKALFGAVSELLKTPLLRERYGESAYEKIEQHFRQESVAKELLKIYEKN